MVGRGSENLGRGWVTGGEGGGAECERSGGDFPQERERGSFVGTKDHPTA